MRRNLLGVFGANVSVASSCRTEQSEQNCTFFGHTMI